MWTDDAADEIISISTDDLEREPRTERTVVKQRSLCRHLLRSKFSFLVLATVTVLFAGLLPFVAFRAALLSSSQALFASQNSRPFRAQSTNSNRMPEQGVPAFDIVVARDVDRERSLANHLYTEHVPVQPLRPLPGDRVRPATAHHHNTPVAPDKLLPQVMEYPKPCDSKSCQREALNVSEQLDDSVSPCDDFYTHVCRRWSQRVAVPNGSARVSVDSLTQDLLTDFVDAAFRHYSQDLERVADLYNECRSHKSGDFERPLFDGLMRGFGNVSWFLSIRTMASKLRTSVWPLFKDFGDTNLSTRVGMFYRTINEPALFSIKPTTDSDFPNETLISIGLPSLVMGSFLLPPTRGNYSYISEAMDLILRQSNLTHGVKVNVLNVEMTLARAMAVGQPDSPRLLQVRELPSAGKLKWDAVFRAMMAETDLNFSSIYVSVESMRYLYALQEALLELQDVEIMAYLGFRTKLVLAPLLRDDEALSLLGALAVSEFPEWHPSLSRKHYCLRFFERFEPALSLYAAREQIGQSMRRLRAVTFVGTVKKAVLEEMASLFPKPFLEHVSLALKSAKWTALMPDWVRAERPRTKYIDYFFTRGRMPVHQQFSLLIRLKNANQYQRYLTGDFFDAPWTGGVLATSAGVTEDRVDVPPGAFDFFRADADEPSLAPLQVARLAPRLLNSVYRHVFDKALAFLYHTGHQKSWVLLDDARSCVWSQFSDSDTPEGMSLRSDRMRWPLLAHVLSAAPSFKAFLASLDGDLYLKGLERLSSEKLYFIYYALNYCETNDDRFLASLLEAGVEPPAWHIVNGALRNFQTFADVFNCSVGSFMNPEQKCAWSF